MTSPNKYALAFATFIVRRPLVVIVTLLALGLGAGFATTKLRINSNQLDLISQDLREVKDVKRIIDMVGGSGYLMLALRSNEEARMKHVADDIVQMLNNDRENVRFTTYRVPVEFVQEKMVLFIKTDDLIEI